MSEQTMKIINCHDRSYEVDPRLDGFDINKRASTNIDFFGYNEAMNAMFFQFRNGTTYMYQGLPSEVITESLRCESIGKFFHSHIKGKYESVGFAIKLINEVRE